MSITYTHDWLDYDKRTFSVSYKDLKEAYQCACMETDEEFINDLPKYIHLACVICWFKEISTDVCLCDRGIIHELAHLLHLKEESQIIGQLQQIRELFKEQLKLS